MSHFPGVRLIEEHPRARTAIVAPSLNTFVTSSDFIILHAPDAWYFAIGHRATHGRAQTPRAPRDLRVLRLNSRSYLRRHDLGRVVRHSIREALVLVCHRNGLAAKLRPRLPTRRRHCS
jgi:hypothetical protein